MSQPKFKVAFPGSNWCAVVTEDGSHFYHNSQTRQSVWRADDEELRDAVTSFDRRVFLLLVAKARGLKLDGSANDLLPQAQEKAHGEEVDPEETREDLPLESTGGTVEEQPKLQVKSGLVSGYSSSDDSGSEDDSQDQDEPQRQTNETSKAVIEPTTTITEELIEPESELIAREDSQRSEHDDSFDDGNGFDLAELDGISSDEDQGQQISTEQAEASFFELLQESSLDPFSPWETESLRIVNDSRFLDIDNNKDRKRLFDTWCAMAISMKKDEVKSPVKKFKETPLVEFMRFLEGQECDRFYMDFKKKWKHALDTLGLSDREKEKTYKEYVIFSKKSQQDREKIFRALLTSAKIFKRNLLSSERVNETLDSVDLDALVRFDTDEAYGVLHDLEEKFDISQSITQQTKYFVVDVKARISLIVEVSRLLLGS